MLQTTNQSSKKPYLFDHPEIKTDMSFHNNSHSNSEFIEELCQTRPLKRLKNIGFLGALDYYRAAQHRHNRFQHSLAVAEMATYCARRMELTIKEQLLLEAAALLHDVGHCPLSHTLEPIFEEYFGINHHQVGTDIILGKTKLGAGVIKILKKYSVDADEVIALINGKHTGSFNFLFGGQINLDTIEGISRSLYFIQNSITKNDKIHIVNKLCNLNYNHDTTVLDNFWKLKNLIYNNFIKADIGLVLDTVAQAYMKNNIKNFRKDDFFSTDKVLQKKHKNLFNLCLKMSDMLKEQRKKNNDKQMFYTFNFIDNKIQHNETVKKTWEIEKSLDLELCVKKRNFFIASDEKINNTESINKRYQQSHENFITHLKDLLVS